MRRILALTWVGAFAIAGCASSSSEERKAELHEQRAQRAASIGDYTRAAAEQRRADEGHREARRRAAEERNELQQHNGAEPGIAPMTNNPTAPPPGVPY